MASRHLSRALVLQTLFESDLMGVLNTDQPALILKRNAKEFTLGASDIAFAESLLKGVLGKQAELDAVTVQAAPQWPLDKIAPIDRNVLRIGLYELLFGDRASVPPKVALNEAIEIAKSFGGEQSGKFVNGVLGTVYKDIGEPQKADAPKAHTVVEDALAGAVVLTGTGTHVHVALVRDVFHHWSLPKTKLEPGELTQAAALRATERELGIAVVLSTPLGEHRYRAHQPGGEVERAVSFFLGTVDTQLSLTCTGDGVVEARWVALEALSTIPLYEDQRAIIDAAVHAYVAP
jgi:transcription antitermination protein NusB